MAEFVTLDEVAHADLRVEVGFGASAQAQVNQTLVFPTEFIQLAKEYPIFFRRGEDQKYFAVVLLGLDRNENLFLDQDSWNARYVPAVMERGPFGLAIGSSPDESVIQIDLSDARTSTERGERVFLPHGGATPYLEAVRNVLNRIHVGAHLVDQFFEHLQTLDLIEPLTLQANLSDELQYTVPDIYTISKERMGQLTGDQLHHLNQLGLLEHCFAIMSSAENFSKLVDKKALQAKG